MSLIAQTTQPAGWTAQDVILVIGAIATVLVPALIMLLKAVKDLRKDTAAQLETHREKINEVADKNQAEVSPIPPPDKPL